MKVLITGADSFIGQYLVTKLKQEGHRVVGAYTTKELFSKNKDLPDTSKYVFDLQDPKSIDKLIEETKPEIVIHLAAKTEVALSFDNYLEVSSVNYVGTVALAESNRRLNPDLKLFIMASTMETYGHQRLEDGAFTEDTIQYPMAPYAVAKLACERYLEYMEYAYNFPFTIIRQTNAYGRTDNDFFVVERIVTQMLKRGEVNLGDPDPWRNFLYIDDLTELYATIIRKHKVAAGETFVTGPDNALQIKDLAKIIASKTKFNVSDVTWHTMAPRPGEIYYLNSNPEHAKKILGWEPKVSLDEGLDKTIEIWRKNFSLPPL